MLEMGSRRAPVVKQFQKRSWKSLLVTSARRSSESAAGVPEIKVDPSSELGRKTFRHLASMPEMWAMVISLPSSLVHCLDMDYVGAVTGVVRYHHGRGRPLIAEASLQCPCWNSEILGDAVGFRLPQQRSTDDVDARSRSGLLQHKQPRRKLPQPVPEFAQVRSLGWHEVMPFCKFLSSVGGASRPLYGIWWTPEEFDAKAVEVAFPWDLDSLLHDEAMKTMAFVLER
eukprot:5234251-Amphidinium_carterae.2